MTTDHLIGWTMDRVPECPDGVGFCSQEGFAELRAKRPFADRRAKHACLLECQRRFDSFLPAPDAAEPLPDETLLGLLRQVRGKGAVILTCTEPPRPRAEHTESKGRDYLRARAVQHMWQVQVREALEHLANALPFETVAPRRAAKAGMLLMLADRCLEPKLKDIVSAAVSKQSQDIGRVLVTGLWPAFGLWGGAAE